MMRRQHLLWEESRMERAHMEVVGFNSERLEMARHLVVLEHHRLVLDRYLMRAVVELVTMIRHP